MKLIKITNDHYVVVDDEPIEEGDYCTTHLNVIDVGKIHNSYTIFNPQNKEHLDMVKCCKRITHTTDININELYYISLQEVKELIGEVDVEKKAFEYTSASQAHRRGFIDGYNQALEDNKDKKYTEEDMIEFAIWRSITLFDQPDPLTPKGQFELWKSLQSKTEWEIEEIDGKFKLK